MTSRKTLKNISEIRRFFHRNEVPIFFVSATNFNLLGIDEWVRNFKYINYIDCYDGRHPNVICPKEQPHAVFQSIEDINNYLLQHKEVVDYIEGRGPKPKLVFLMFDEKTEALAKAIRRRRVVPEGEAALACRQQDRDGEDRKQGRRAERSEHSRRSEELRRSYQARKGRRPRE